MRKQAIKYGHINVVIFQKILHLYDLLFANYHNCSSWIWKIPVPDMIDNVFGGTFSLTQSNE